MNTNITNFFKRGQWYLHQFLPEQPDLNYRNNDVKKEIQVFIELMLKFTIFVLE
jgi:glycosidase